RASRKPICHPAPDARPSRASRPPRGSARDLAHDLAGRLVVAQALVAGLAQLAAPRPLGERDLRHQLRLGPARLARRITGGEWRGAALAPLQLIAQPVERALVEPGPHLARVAQPAVGQVVADQQRPEAPPRAPRRRPAADHELLPVRALDLQPVARAGRDVRARGELCEDALPAALARRAERGLA